jgi:2-aminoadipate transaminase
VARPALQPGLELPSVAPRPGAPLQLGSVFIDPRLLPRATLAECMQQVLDQGGLEPFGEPQGNARLRAEIAKRLRARGIVAQPEHIITTVGSQHALDMVSRSLLRGRIATEDPAYHLGKALLERNRTRPLGLPIDPFSGVDLPRWEARLRRHRPALLYLTPRYQNPTGYSYSHDELQRILGWARELGCAVLEDDWAAEMLPEVEPAAPLRSLGGEHVLYMNSFTKKIWPSLRIGYVLADPATIQALLTTKRVAVGSSPALGEAVLAAFLERGGYEAHLATLQPELSARHDHCVELLRAQMPDDVRWTVPHGGPMLWVELPRRVDLPALCKRVRTHDVLLPLSDAAFFGRPHLHGFKLGYACITRDEMQRGVEVLAREMHRIASSRSGVARGRRA